MGTPRLLSRAPIQEALIDIQFVSEVIPEVGAIAAEFVDAYRGKSADMWESLVQFRVEPETAPSTAAMPATAIGKRVDFTDRQQVLQLRSNGFTFSRLPSYVNWEEMSQAGMALWRQYGRRTGAKEVTRVALRYINAIDLPLPVVNFADYLGAPPPVPNGVPQLIANFLTRIVVPKDQDLATITQLSQGMNADKTALRMTLDIEIVTACSLRGDDFEGLAALLDRQRVFKNEVFFAHLTNKTLEMYE